MKLPAEVIRGFTASKKFIRYFWTLCLYHEVIVSVLVSGIVTYWYTKSLVVLGQLYNFPYKLVYHAIAKNVTCDRDNEVVMVLF